jgi:uncharacterized damage-inducible protein DinB
MSLKPQFELLATYNQWMNEKLYEAAAQLTPAELATDRRAFFGSIAGTLNHVVVADTIWLQRFASHPCCRDLLVSVAELPSPASLDQMLFDDFARMSQHRGWLDERIIEWIASLTEGDMSVVITYRNMKGVESSRRLSHLLLHFFNHQTHHRGQASALLSQAGIDLGVTDLLVKLPEEDR